MASKENRSEAMVSGADGINQGENLDPIGEGLDDHHGNLDQGLSSAMVLFKKKLTDGEEEDDDVLDVDLGEEVEEMKSKWLIIARFYSGQRYNVKGLFEEMSIAWNLTQQRKTRSLGDNRFLVEFACEADYNRVVYGGPWKHRRSYTRFPAERECPEVGSSSAQVRFGKELRASPLKRKLQSFASSSISTPKAAKVLNFSGAQREKVLTASSSSKAPVLSNPKLNSGGVTMFLVGEKADQEEKAASVEAEASLYPLPKGITAALEEGVSQMKMQLDDGELNLAARGPCSRERVSMSSDYGLSGEETPQHSAGIVSGVVNQDVKSLGGQSKKKQWVPTRETDRAVKAKSLSIGRDIGKPRKITVRLSADAVEAYKREAKSQRSSSERSGGNPPTGVPASVDTDMPSDV
uniref:DUF4283 domain-containing protein n=1 Tax=Oryza barthii TaxID=65489 RepID=A0A0D3EQ65_9ORYZ